MSTLSFKNQLQGVPACGASQQAQLSWLGGVREEVPQVTVAVSVSVPGSWSWKTARAGCSRSCESVWPWKVSGGHLSGKVKWAALPGRAPDASRHSADHLKTEEELSEEKKILNEMLEVVEQRDSLVVLLEEQRLREKEEDKDLEAAMLCKGFSLDWS